MHPTHFMQHGFEVRCEWGPEGLDVLTSVCDAIIIIDILSFSTCVDAAVSRGATVVPASLRGEEAAALAATEHAILAGPRSIARPSLSPCSLTSLGPGIRVVLPSPNGSTLSAAAPRDRTFAACLRNRTAVAAAAAGIGRRIGIIPAGERWPGGTRRNAWEDLIGAGAVIERLSGARSPEAHAAVAAWKAAEPHLTDQLMASVSGRELVEKGFSDDVVVAAQLDTSSAAPRLVDGSFVSA